MLIYPTNEAAHQGLASQLGKLAIRFTPGGPDGIKVGELSYHNPWSDGAGVVFLRRNLVVFASIGRAQRLDRLKRTFTPLPNLEVPPLRHLRELVTAVDNELQSIKEQP